MASDKVFHVTDASFETEVMKSATPVLIDFWAPWCAPCRAIAPMVDELATEYEGRLKVVKINVDDNPQVQRVMHGIARNLHERATIVAGATGANAASFEFVLVLGNERKLRAVARFQILRTVFPFGSHALQASQKTTKKFGRLFQVVDMKREFIVNIQAEARMGTA